MAIQKRVLVKWHDEPESKAFIADVSIDQEWNSMDDYDNMFFYFASKKELEQAKKAGDNGYEFRILWAEADEDKPKQPYIYDDPGDEGPDEPFWVTPGTKWE